MSAAEDDDALCEKLTAVLGDESLRSQMGRAAAESAEYYDWSVIAKQIVSVYTELVGVGAGIQGRLTVA